MNETKVRNQISQLIAEQQSKQVTRKQYPVAKSQTAKLTELGILHLMPEHFGYTDAAVVIEAATSGKTAVFNAMGEGEEIPAAPLFTVIRETETTSDDDGEVVETRDELDNLIDEVAAMENEKAVKAAFEDAQRDLAADNS
jgi:hypothetical protein